MFRIAQIDFVSDTALVVIPSTLQDRARGVIARINRVPASSIDLQEAAAGRLSLSDQTASAPGAIGHTGGTDDQAS